MTAQLSAVSNTKAHPHPVEVEVYGMGLSRSFILCCKEWLKSVTSLSFAKVSLSANTCSVKVPSWRASFEHQQLSIFSAQNCTLRNPDTIASAVSAKGQYRHQIADRFIECLSLTFHTQDFFVLAKRYQDVTILLHLRQCLVAPTFKGLCINRLSSMSMSAYREISSDVGRGSFT